MNSQVENDIVLGGIDAFLPTGPAQRDILEGVDDIMTQAVEAGRPEKAFQAMRGLLGISQISGLAFAKFIYVMSFQWDKFNRRDGFWEAAEEEFGRKKITLQRNYNVWDMLVSDDVPREYAEKFKTMPIRCLIPISNMWKQGWEVESHQWMKLANAPDPSTINKIIREIKKTEPKEGSLQTEWYPDESRLVFWKNSEPHNVYLAFDGDDVVVQAGLERLFGDGRALIK